MSNLNRTSFKRFLFHMITVGSYISTALGGTHALPKAGKAIHFGDEDTVTFDEESAHLNTQWTHLYYWLEKPSNQELKAKFATDPGYAHFKEVFFHKDKNGDLQVRRPITKDRVENREWYSSEEKRWQYLMPEELKKNQLLLEKFSNEVTVEYCRGHESTDEYCKAHYQTKSTLLKQAMWEHHAIQELKSKVNQGESTQEVKRRIGQSLAMIDHLNASSCSVQMNEQLTLDPNQHHIAELAESLAHVVDQIEEGALLADSSVDSKRKSLMRAKKGLQHKGGYLEQVKERVKEALRNDPIAVLELLDQNRALLEDNDLMNSVASKQAEPFYGEEDERGDTLLHFAANAGYVEVLKKMLETEKTYIAEDPQFLVKNKKNETPLDLAIMNSNLAVLKVYEEVLKKPDLIKELTKSQGSGLVGSHIEAIATGGQNRRLAKHLGRNHFPLIVTALGGNDLHAAAVIGDVDKVRDLMAHHPEMLTEFDKFEGSPITYAVNMDHPEVVKILLENAPANLSQVLTHVNAFRNTPLRLVKKIPSPTLDLIKSKLTFAEYAAELNNFTPEATPLHSAIDPSLKGLFQEVYTTLGERKFLEILIAYRVSDGRNPLHLVQAGDVWALNEVERFIGKEKLGLLLLAKTHETKHSMLGISADVHDIEMIHKIHSVLGKEKFNAELVIKNSNGINPMGIAAIQAAATNDIKILDFMKNVMGNVETFKSEITEQMVALSKLEGAPLVIAAKNGHLEAVQFLENTISPNDLAEISLTGADEDYSPVVHAAANHNIEVLDRFMSLCSSQGKSERFREQMDSAWPDQSNIMTTGITRVREQALNGNLKAIAFLEKYRQLYPSIPSH